MSTPSGNQIPGVSGVSVLSKNECLSELSTHSDIKFKLFCFIFFHPSLAWLTYFPKLSTYAPRCNTRSGTCSRSKHRRRSYLQTLPCLWWMICSTGETGCFSPMASQEAARRLRWSEARPTAASCRAAWTCCSTALGSLVRPNTCSNLIR